MEPEVLADRLDVEAVARDTETRALLTELEEEGLDDVEFIREA